MEATRRSMRGLAVASACALTLAAAHGARADDVVATKAAAFSYVGRDYNWNGFYAGSQMGYTWGTSNWTASSPGAPNVSGALSLAQRIDAFNGTGSYFAGLQAGYNYMLRNRIVVGGEVDATFPTFQIGPESPPAASRT
jgi:high affinity Mn2+ porin